MKKEKDTFYFTHDFNARNDPKLQKVLMCLGQEGIGVFWGVIEMLYEQGGALEINNINAIAFQLHVKIEVVEKLIHDFDLFKKDATHFWSESVNRRLRKREEISKGRRQAALKRWGEKGTSTDGEKEPEGDNTTIPNGGEHPPKPPKIDFNAIIQLYHTICPSFPKVFKLTDARKNKIRVRLVEMNHDFEILKQVFSNMESSKFMKGDNKKGWKASFDWIFENPVNWVRTYEGNYENVSTGKTKTEETNNANAEWK